MRKTALIVVISVIILTAAASYFAGLSTGVGNTSSQTVNTVTKTVTETFTTTVGQVGTVTTTVTSFKRQVEEVCFSRTQRCDVVIASLVDRAQVKVYVMVYSFTLDSLADALINAVKRGVDVRVVMERDQAGVRGSEYERLRRNGVEVRLDNNPYLMHHKVAVIDGQIVVTGSYNWSVSAENNNDENIAVINDPETATLYEQEFMRVWNNAS